MKDKAIQNAINRVPGQSFCADEIVIGVAKNHVAISWNNTTYNQNMVVVLQQRDAQTLFALLLQAGKAAGWVQ